MAKETVPQFSCSSYPAICLREDSLSGDMSFDKAGTCICKCEGETMKKNCWELIGCGREQNGDKEGENFLH